MLNPTSRYKIVYSKSSKCIYVYKNDKQKKTISKKRERKKNRTEILQSIHIQLCEISF